MDNQLQTAQPTKPISDDQELAKVLAGITNNVNNNMGFEETPVVGTTTPAPVSAPVAATPEPQATPAPAPEANPLEQPVIAPALEPLVGNGFSYDESMGQTMPQAPDMLQPLADNNLDGIRKEVLDELRPLVGKLDLAPEERFDIYLLLLRSTDDTTLIAPAHEAAKNIADEPRRAQALLDIIKEIDYLSKAEQLAA